MYDNVYGYLSKKTYRDKDLSIDISDATSIASEYSVTYSIYNMITSDIVIADVTDTEIYDNSFLIPKELLMQLNGQYFVLFTVTDNNDSSRVKSYRINMEVKEHGNG